MSGHAGTYIGNGYVIEATKNSTFKIDGVGKTQIGPKGERLYNGKQSGKWEQHGQLRWVDYSEVVNTYIVKGDTLESISKETGVSIDAIKKANDLQGNVLFVGQELVIPHEDKYIIINTKSGVWSRLDGYGLDKPKYKVIPYNTKCVLLQKNVGTKDGYNWDKIIYDGKECFLPNRWSLYE